MNIPRLVIAGASSGVGKTTFSLAIMAALTRRGFAVYPYKAGPDYIDPTFHQAATGRTSRNLDPWLLSPESLLRIFRRRDPPAPGQTAPSSGPDREEIAVIEGVMGLFDGQGAGSLGSTAHLASLLKAPALLLISGEGLSLSAAALAAGYAGFRPHARLEDLRVAAVLINRVSGPGHYALLRQGIEENTALPCLGCLPRNAVPTLPERRLGLVPAAETDRLPELLAALADAAERYLDLAALVELARGAPPLPDEPDKTGGMSETGVAGTTGVCAETDGQDGTGEPRSANFCPRGEAPVPPGGEVRSAPRPSRRARVRVGLARDRAFSFYYQDNLDLLTELGAELVPFSPLEDRALPAGLDGLYLGGGFPERSARALEANRELRARIAALLEDGLPAYAEGGALLYLCSSLTLSEQDGSPGQSSGPERFAMAGFFPERAEMSSRLQAFGYVSLTLRADCLLGPAGTLLRAHEFHYSRLLAPDPPLTGTPAVFSAAKAGGKSREGGLGRKNVLAMFPHLHFHSCPEVARRFIAMCVKETLIYSV